MPWSDFFKNCLWFNEFKESFSYLNKLLMSEYNNICIREARDNICLYIFDQILFKVWKIRKIAAGWSMDQRYEALPIRQKYLLDPTIYPDVEKTEWKEAEGEFLRKAARWLVRSYSQVIKNQNGKYILLGDNDIKYIEGLFLKQRDVLI
ncbi:type I-F CRISPR-associated protein Csy1 [Piscirickettsia litoralis]|uniref:type I-F CRISPR-associated protein Csy1 n=1 Tax=Piscirickettsia litoralis TaxID=1891921 RepID=UPI000981ED50|nr:type I-F CRISPR-associated protein Csy1 [Piscirickettsia litoralis]